MFLLTEYWSLDKSHTPIHVFVTNFDTVEYYFHTIFDTISILYFSVPVLYHLA